MSPTTSTYERGLKVTSVAPLNLNPKLEKLLKLNQAYKGNSSKMEGTQYLDETMNTNRAKKRQDPDPDINRQDVIKSVESMR